MSDPQLFRELIALRSRLDRLERNETSTPFSCRYTSTLGQSCASMATVTVNFNQQTFDERSLVQSGADWQFIAPSACRVAVAAGVRFASASWPSGRNATLAVWKNGVRWSYLDFWMPESATNAILVFLTGTDTVDLAAGDTLDIRVRHTLTQSLSLDTNPEFMSCAIWRI